MQWRVVSVVVTVVLVTMVVLSTGLAVDVVMLMVVDGCSAE